MEARKAMGVALSAVFLVLGLAVGGLAQDPAGSRVLAAATGVPPGVSPAGRHEQANQKRTMLTMQPAKLPPGVQLPPVDVKVPAKTETATFALG
jgi:hypothetical protein